ncbi:N-acetylmuramoyl-L-alanine amidase [Streptomyces sp. HNM0574]|uniref:N-acetylmuramoyl-L-alanine amidase n=1 Tax=Streptomyces sp. HNM0574 TaxID=2714954 RepID=UPI00146A8787|nr:N-acetylmuramoyl-L-alanine amidase [Streptomyces sp. HNM0574]NLU68721.1 N-acetylmuramoyl-L-alanine amidase [Streptomyces sp. HNM0574]
MATGPAAARSGGLISTADYPDAEWIPANGSNFTPADRPSEFPIEFVVIHVTQGSFAGTVQHFQNPEAKVSAHYVVRSNDGHIAQMVHDKDVAWHAGNWDYNTRSIGIEHEGFVDDPAWFTDAMYAASAALTASLCDTWGIPRDRTRVIGHNEVPGADHTDPGQHWDWDRYMTLLSAA